MGLFRGGEQKGRGVSRRRAVVSVLDIGSTKICCMVGRLKAAPPGEALRARSHAVEILGIGHQRSRGIKSGVVVNQRDDAIMLPEGEGLALDNGDLKGIGEEFRERRLTDPRQRLDPLAGRVEIERQERREDTESQTFEHIHL